MAIEFIGYPNIKHVEQPPGSDKCFAAIISAVGETSLSEVHEVLADQEISEPSGKTYPMARENVLLGDSVVSIEPFLSPFAGYENTESVIDLIDEQFVAVKAVALLYKKTVDKADDSHHWILLPGVYKDGDKRLSTVVMDPLQKHFGYLRQPEMHKIIERSLNYAGVYGYSLERLTDG